MAPRTPCSTLRKHIDERDLRASFVAGDDLLVLVNRSPMGQLPADWSPTDLVDLHSGQKRTAGQCESRLCLRAEAAQALTELLGEMKARGFPGRVESAYRGYQNQCGTFLHWASKSSFCAATEQSALPGHSQHQLGTTVDLFTEEWAKDPRGVFRDGFGCTPAGTFVREHATDFGFVMPYPIHTDDRNTKRDCTVRVDIKVPINPKTGYRFEHWHIRYIGKDAAARFAEAFRNSGPGSPSEITLEQWLRREKGIGDADAELPECDGCNCGACSTLAPQGEHPCDKKGGALHLDEYGRPLRASTSPQIMTFSRTSINAWIGVVLEVTLSIPEGIVTQPPIFGAEGFGYATSSSYMQLSPYPETPPRAFPPLTSAWMVAVEPIPNTTGVDWPWRAGLSTARVGQTYNRANLRLPSPPGSLSIKIPVVTNAQRARVTLMEDGIPKGETRILELR